MSLLCTYLFSAMVHYIALYQLNRDKSEEEFEDMIRSSRVRLHQVREAYQLRCGRNIDTVTDHGFFVSADFESLAKLAMFRDDPNYQRFQEEVVRKHFVDTRELIFETDPGKNPKYS